VLALLTSSGEFLIVASEKEHREDKNHNPELRLMLDKRIARLRGIHSRYTDIIPLHDAKGVLKLNMTTLRCSEKLVNIYQVIRCHITNTFSMIVDYNLLLDLRITKQCARFDVKASLLVITSRRFERLLCLFSSRVKQGYLSKHPTVGGSPFQFPT
jgi:hypothetical protein